MATTKKKTAAAAKKTGAKLKNFATAPINKSLSKDEKIDLYRMIVGIRRFEERSLRAYNQGRLVASSTFILGKKRLLLESSP